MRRPLIDYARRKKAKKRGGAARRIEDFENVVEMAMHGDPDEVLALDEALVRLEGKDARAAAVVRLRFFAGLSGNEAAQVLGISPRQAEAVDLRRRLLGNEARETLVSRNNLGLLLQAQGRLPEAESCLREVLAV